MKSILMIVTGVILLLISVFGGSYFLHIYDYTHWLNFPVFFTAMILFFSGITLVGVGSVNCKWD